MLRFFIVVAVTIFFHSSIALGVNTAEKWYCSKDGYDHFIRLAAVSVGAHPCKIYYTERQPGDTNEVILQAAQDAGDIDPVIFSTVNGNFCVRKLKKYVEDKKAHGWVCTKVL